MNLDVGLKDEITVNILEMKIQTLRQGGDDFNKYFVMYVCSTFLAPVANRVIDNKIIKYCDNVKEIPNLDCCSYVLENLCNAVQRLKNNKNKEARSGISGSRRYVTYDISSTLFSDIEIHEKAKDELEEDLMLLLRDTSLFSMLHANRINEITQRLRDVADRNTILVEEVEVVTQTQRLLDDPRVQRAFDEVVRLYDDLKDRYTEVNIADDGDDIHEEPNEDLNNVVSSVTESILKDTVAATKDNGDNGEEDDPSQPTPKTNEKEIPSPSTHVAELNQGWYDWMCLCDAKEKIIIAQLIFIPICLSNHYSLVVVNLLKETIQYMDNKEYDDRDRPFYKILVSPVEVMQNMSLKCKQVIDYLSINEDENFPNKSKVVGWFGESIEIIREDCNILLNEWKASTNLITAWSNHLNSNERQKERYENDLVRFFFGLEFMDALTMCLNAHGKKGVTSLQKLWIDCTKSQSLDLDAAECVYDGVNGIGLGTIKAEFQRLTHHYIKTVLDLLLNDNNQMQEKLLTNVKDWDEKKAQKSCEEERKYDQSVFFLA
uniref:Ubiquitin-like protease family profile domain-containing protein n=1 Tax=Chenopodium quinoa TaxID=63459 RepID=A0A803N9K9_CHEQI